MLEHYLMIEWRLSVGARAIVEAERLLERNVESAVQTLLTVPFVSVLWRVLDSMKSLHPTFVDNAKVAFLRVNPAV
jgi:hypothetical protein